METCETTGKSVSRFGEAAINFIRFAILEALINFLIVAFVILLSYLDANCFPSEVTLQSLQRTGNPSIPIVTG